jgi:penicillin-binding protein 1A
MDDAPPDRNPVRIRRAARGAAAAWRDAWASPPARITIAAIGLLVIGWLVFWLMFARGLPSAERLLAYEPPLPTNVRAYDGTPVYSYARERRVELSFDEYPPVLVHAYLAAEDKTFFSHGGLDLPGFAGAVIDYVRKIGSGKRAKGGSTITQQVAKNLLVGDEYSIRRKIREAILAYRIEGVLTKQ